MNREDPCAGLIVCESCLAILSEEETESYQERHGPYSHQLETLRRTTCCESAYYDLNEQAVVDELKRIQEWKSTDGVHIVVMSLNQTMRDNLEQIQIILETEWEL